jgi:sporadic carbohydrate cluster 2OG-Fe(II) oxygenase
MSKFFDEFEQNRYAVFPNAQPKIFAAFQKVFKDVASDFIGKPVDDLTLLHHDVTLDQINPLRVKIFNALNALPNWRKDYYALAGEQLTAMFGPDISIQIKLCLSIQMPGDAGSLLMLHSDTMSGQSQFECVLWTAVTDAFDTNAMYIYPPAETKKIYDALPAYQNRGMNELFEDTKDKATIAKARAGDCILFSSTLFHGNQVNKTDKTRISLNCRFKSLFSPEYAAVPHERTTGTFYEPLSMSPVTKIGLAYDENILF